MANINWIATTAKNFSDATAWQGGVVPGINDTAVFTSVGNGGGAGDCTLDAAFHVGSFKLLADYGGAFSLNGKQLSVGTGGQGVFHSLKVIPMVNTSANNTIHFYGHDVLLGGAVMDTLAFHTDCEIRATASALGGITVDSGTTLKFRVSRHPDWPALVNSPNFYTGANTARINGTLDLTEASLWRLTRGPGGVVGSSTPSLDFSTGTIRNTSSQAVPIDQSLIFNLNVGRVEGRFSLNYTLYTSATSYARGDLRQFESVTVTWGMSSAQTYNMADTMIDRLVLIGGTANMNVILPGVSEIHGDFLLIEKSTGKIALKNATGTPPTLTAAGTADQVFDTGSNTMGLIGNKPAGLLTLASGDYTLAGNSIFYAVINSCELELPSGLNLDCAYIAVGTAKFYGAGTWKARGLTRAVA